MPRPLSPEQRDARAAFVRAALGRGMSFVEIAAVLGMKVATLHTWWQRGGKNAQPTFHTAPDRIERELARAGVKQRLCLQCGGPFGSTGPGNRRCARCVSNASSMSPYAPDPGGDTGRRMQARRGA